MRKVTTKIALPASIATCPTTNVPNSQSVTPSLACVSVAMDLAVWTAQSRCVDHWQEITIKDHLEATKPRVAAIVAGMVSTVTCAPRTQYVMRLCLMDSRGPVISEALW